MAIGSGCNRSDPPDVRPAGADAGAATARAEPAAGDAKPTGAAAGVAHTPPARPRLDWTQHATSGAVADVTEQLRGNLSDGALDLIVGRVTLPADARLESALVDHRFLKLRIRIAAPGQSVTFEGLNQLATANYAPQGAPRRGVRLSSAKHTEPFARAGVLEVAVRNPNPDPAALVKVPPRPAPPDPGQYKLFPGQPTPDAATEAPPLLPDAKAGYKPRSEAFARLAAAVSFQYKMPGRDTTKWSKEFWRKHAAEAGAVYPDPQVQKYARAILERAKSDLSLDPQALRAQLLREADALASRTLGPGALKGYDGDRPVFASGNEPDPAAQAEARRLRDVARLGDADLKEWAARQRDQNTFEDLLFGNGVTNNREHQYTNLVSDAYKALTAEAKKHAGPAAAGSLVRMTRPGSARYVLRNVSGKALTDVVLSMNWAFAKSDRANEFGRGHPVFAFVPVWKPNEEVEFALIPREPSVLQALVTAYSTEATTEGEKFSLLDPASAPRK